MSKTYGTWNMFWKACELNEKNIKRGDLRYRNVTICNDYFLK